MKYLQKKIFKIIQSKCKVNHENIQSKLVLQIHDELIFDVKNDELEKVENIVKDAMENIVSLSVPLKVSTDVGTNWYDLK